VLPIELSAWLRTASAATAAAAAEEFDADAAVHVVVVAVDDDVVDDWGRERDLGRWRQGRCGRHRRCRGGAGRGGQQQRAKTRSPGNTALCKSADKDSNAKRAMSSAVDYIEAGYKPLGARWELRVVRQEMQMATCLKRCWRPEDLSLPI
jgi:hypothetical protein